MRDRECGCAESGLEIAASKLYARQQQRREHLRPNAISLVLLLLHAFDRAREDASVDAELTIDTSPLPSSSARPIKRWAAAVGANRERDRDGPGARAQRGAAAAAAVQH